MRSRPKVERACCRERVTRRAAASRCDATLPGCTFAARGLLASGVGGYATIRIEPQGD